MILGIVLIFVEAELFVEEFTRLIPTAGEILEEGGSILFGGFSQIYFLKEDIRKLIKEINSNKQ